MYHIIRLYGSKIINIIQLGSFLQIHTIGALFIQLIRDFFCFHFRECRFLKSEKWIQSADGWTNVMEILFLQHFLR